MGDISISVADNGRIVLPWRSAAASMSCAAAFW